MSHSETVGGKARDAVAAVPSLVEEFRTARYVVDHREEIQEAVDHLSANTVPESELREAADEATGTLRAVEEPYVVDVDDTWTALGDGRLPSAFDHARERTHRDVLAEVAAVVDEETYRALSRQLGASYEDDEGVASGRRS